MSHSCEIQNSSAWDASLEYQKPLNTNSSSTVFSTPSLSAILMLMGTFSPTLRGTPRASNTLLLAAHSFISRGIFPFSG